MKRSTKDAIKLIGQSWVLLAVLIVMFFAGTARAGSVNTQSVIDIMKRNPDKVYACTMYSIAFADGMYWWAKGEETADNIPWPANVKKADDATLYVRLIAAGMEFAKSQHEETGTARDMYMGLSRQFYEGMYNACVSARGHPSVIKALPTMTPYLVNMYESIYNYTGAVPQKFNDVDLGQAQGRYYANCVSKCKTKKCVKECGDLYPHGKVGKFVKIQSEGLERPKVLRPKYKSYGIWNRIEGCMHNRGLYFQKCMDANSRHVVSQNDLVHMAQYCDSEVLEKFFACADLYPK